ncbi:hypothetical protein J3458_018882 [Metarhizium acridum]|uniref:uncharacterized protein n=1 Tax=Metarhizium acridum TaxID=92637 RepID=UPI001C6D0ED2|nr:hypothetical protein J3458_018882 [Metarhizium acridum]
MVYSSELSRAEAMRFAVICSHHHLFIIFRRDYKRSIIPSPLTCPPILGAATRVFGHLWQSLNRRKYAAQGFSRRHAATASNATFPGKIESLELQPEMGKGNRSCKTMKPVMQGEQYFTWLIVLFFYLPSFLFQQRDLHDFSGFLFIKSMMHAAGADFVARLVVELSSLYEWELPSTHIVESITMRPWQRCHFHRRNGPPDLQVD